MNNKKVAIIGCGNLGQSILKGLIDEANYPTTHITVTKRNLDTLSTFKSSGIQLTNDNHKAIRMSDIIIIALKPYTILEVLDTLKADIDPDRHIVVSLATGISIAALQNTLGTSVPVFRAMPNIAADVKESLTCLCGNTDEDEKLKTIAYFFDTIGSTLVIHEDLMTAATVLGACGIAYVLRFIRGMIQGGIQIGFDVKTASAIVNQTVRGAAELLIEREEHPEFEIDKVTTPKGCTIVGLNEMEHNGFSSALIKGIIASYDKIE